MLTVWTIFGLLQTPLYRQKLVPKVDGRACCRVAAPWSSGKTHCLAIPTMLFFSRKWTQEDTLVHVITYNQPPVHMHTLIEKICWPQLTLCLEDAKA